MSVPGVARWSAEVILAETGDDMSKFPTPGHFASWARVCPGNHESAGKRKPVSTGRGNRWLRDALSQVAWAAVRTKGSYYRALYHRHKGRGGPKKAIVVVQHAILVAIRHMLSRGVLPRILRCSDGIAPPGALDCGEFQRKTTRNGGHPDGATSSYRKQASCTRCWTGAARPAQRVQSHRRRRPGSGPQAARPVWPARLDRLAGEEGEGVLPAVPDGRGVDRAAARRGPGDGRPAASGAPGRAPGLRLDPRAGPHDVRPLAEAGR